MIFADIFGVLIAMSIPGIGTFLSTAPLLKQTNGGEIGWNDWYRSLSKPHWAPPLWLLGPVYSFLFTLVGLSSFIIYKSDGDSEDFDTSVNRQVALMLYATQMILSWAWTPVFFYLKKIGGSLVISVALVLVSWLSVFKFFQVNITAGLLQLPFTIWLCYDSAVNYKLYSMNRTRSKQRYI